MVVKNMDKRELKYYENLLLEEKEEVVKTLTEREDNSDFSNLRDQIEELSFYDNHPGDIGSETYQMELNLALKQHQKEELKNIEESLKKIEIGSYGICEFCRSNIEKERLEYMPTAKLCSKCANKRLTSNKQDQDRPVEEKILYPPFHRANIDLKDSVIYDTEDTWQDIQQHINSSSDDDIGKDFESSGFVEKIEKISNEEYKNQLPD